METRRTVHLLVEMSDRTSVYVRMIAQLLHHVLKGAHLEVLTTPVDPKETKQLLESGRLGYIIRIFDSTIFPEQIEAIRILRSAVAPQSQIVWILEDKEDWPEEMSFLPGEIVVHEEHDELARQLIEGCLASGAWREHYKQEE